MLGPPFQLIPRLFVGFRVLLSHVAYDPFYPPATFSPQLGTQAAAGDSRNHLRGWFLPLGLAGLE
jgi:hypothetical protein